MVDVETIGVLITAASVSVAAIYYIMNLRVQQRNMKLTLETRRIGLIENVVAHIVSQEGMRTDLEVANYEWTDYEDFVRKYGQTNNPDAAAKRHWIWVTYNTIGSMLRKGLVEAEDAYDMGMWGSITIWAKYKPIIERLKRTRGQDWLRDFEWVAGEMVKVRLKRDPSWKAPEIFGIHAPEK